MIYQIEIDRERTVSFENTCEPPSSEDGMSGYRVHRRMVLTARAGCVLYGRLSLCVLAAIDTGPSTRVFSRLVARSRFAQRGSQHARTALHRRESSCTPSVVLIVCNVSPESRRHCLRTGRSHPERIRRDRRLEIDSPGCLSGDPDCPCQVCRVGTPETLVR